MSRPGSAYVASSVPHLDAPGLFLGSFSAPGRHPEWVMENGRKKLFASAESAELAAWRMLGSRLNGKKDLGATKRSAPAPRTKEKSKQDSSAIESVFKNFD